jgi:hypothetical protein
MSEPRRPRSESELIEFIRSSDVRAPEALHERVQALARQRPKRPWGRRVRGDEGDTPGERRGSGFPASSRAATGRVAPLLSWRLGAAVAAAAIAGALVAGLTGPGSPGLSVRQASALTLRQPTGAAPQRSASNHDELTAAVDGVAFPYWEDALGWRATGVRSDRTGGRTVTTVFYSNRSGARVGYSIVSGAKPPRISEGVVAKRGGVHYWLLDVNGVAAVTWLRGDRLCVVSGRGVDHATLLRLASWSDSGLTPA